MVMDRREESTWFPRAAQSDRQKDWTGVILSGRYRIEHKLASGSMGVLYRAQQLSLDRSVAIKILWTSDHPAVSKRFLQEAHCAGRISSPFCVTVLDLVYSESHSLHYIVMEYLEGCTVEEWVKRNGPVPRSLGFRLLCHGAMALQALERNHILHKDIKPSNLFF